MKDGKSGSGDSHEDVNLISVVGIVLSSVVLFSISSESLANSAKYSQRNMADKDEKSGSGPTNVKQKPVQAKIEVGHQAICRPSPTASGHTHDWRIFVRGAENADVSHFVEKVVFLLPESFPKPRRVCKKPPYTVIETGHSSFNLPVEVYFRNKEEPRKYRLEYDLTLQLVGLPVYNFSKVELLTFLNPSKDFQKKLLKGGAVILEKEKGEEDVKDVTEDVVKEEDVKEEDVKEEKVEKDESATDEGPVVKDEPIDEGNDDTERVAKRRKVDA